MPSIAGRISKTPGVCGGRACVQGHRIPVWTLAAFRRQGAADAEILVSYPQLTEADLAAAWEYAAAHVEEIGRDIRENEEGCRGDQE